MKLITFATGIEQSFEISGDMQVEFLLIGFLEHEYSKRGYRGSGLVLSPAIIYNNDFGMYNLRATAHLIAHNFTGNSVDVQQWSTELTSVANLAAKHNHSDTRATLVDTKSKLTVLLSSAFDTHSVAASSSSRVVSQPRRLGKKTSDPTAPLTVPAQVASESTMLSSAHMSSKPSQRFPIH